MLQNPISGWIGPRRAWLSVPFLHRSPPSFQHESRPCERSSGAEQPEGPRRSRTEGAEGARHSRSSSGGTGRAPQPWCHCHGVPRVAATDGSGQCHGPEFPLVLALALERVAHSGLSGHSARSGPTCESNLLTYRPFPPIIAWQIPTYLNESYNGNLMLTWSYVQCNGMPVSHAVGPTEH